MRRASFTFLLLLIGVIFTACKDDNSNDPQPEPATYTVAYEFNIVGGYEDLEFSYFEPNFVRKSKSNLNTPWEMTFDNFNKLDSVAINASFKTLLNQTLTVNYKFSISQGTNYSAIYSDSLTITAGTSSIPMQFGNAVVIN